MKILSESMSERVNRVLSEGREAVLGELGSSAHRALQLLEKPNDEPQTTEKWAEATFCWLLFFGFYPMTIMGKDDQWHKITHYALAELVDVSGDVKGPLFAVQARSDDGYQSDPAPLWYFQQTPYPAYMQQPFIYKNAVKLDISNVKTIIKQAFPNRVVTHTVRDDGVHHVTIREGFFVEDDRGPIADGSAMSSDEVLAYMLAATRLASSVFDRIALMQLLEKNWRLEYELEEAKLKGAPTPNVALDDPDENTLYLSNIAKGLNERRLATRSDVTEAINKAIRDNNLSQSEVLNAVIKALSMPTIIQK